jgi:hypothetical protein
MPDRIAELYRLADLSTAILDETGAFIHAMAYPAGFYNDPRMPLCTRSAPRASTCEGADDRLSRKVA